MGRLAPNRPTAQPLRRPQRRRSAVNIIQVMEDPALFLPWFKDRRSWGPWKVFLRVLFGLALSADDLAFFTKCTGRDAPPTGRIEEAWVAVGRRGGKSLILALIGAFLAIFFDWKPYTVPGELALVRIMAADRRQARAIFRYAKAMLEKVPLLAGLIESISDEEIRLTNGLGIEITTASWRTVRGATIVACLCDEVAIWYSDETSANPDSEILRALRPAMAGIPNAMLLCAGSPYARRGEMWEAYKRAYGKPDPTLFWMADTRTMRPSLPQRIIDEAFERDEVAALSEYGRDGLITFRNDLESFVARETVEQAVVARRIELPRVPGVSYVGFTDAAGGSGGDSFTGAVAHREPSGKLIVDAIREKRPPFSPEVVVEEMAALFRAYGVHRIKSDRWGGQFPVEAFGKHGITVEVSDLVKSDIYLAFLPLLNSGKIELLDNKRLISQLCSLERRTARSGKDSVDHPPGANAHDDVINAVAGAAIAASQAKVMVISQKALDWAAGRRVA